MKTIAIMNYKGGVGKTVTTINFAAELAAAGKRVIVMDADGQCNLSDIFRADTLHGGTTYEVLTGEVCGCWDEIIQETPVEDVVIVPASAELPKADIAALTGERLAKNGIRDFCLAVAEDEGADYILIDCPTAYNAATVAALGAADEIIIPVELEGFSLHGAGEICSQVVNMRTVNPRLRIAGALITKRRSTRMQEAAEDAGFRAGKHVQPQREQDTERVRTQGRRDQGVSRFHAGVSEQGRRGQWLKASLT